MCTTVTGKRNLLKIIHICTYCNRILSFIDIKETKPDIENRPGNKCSTVFIDLRNFEEKCQEKKQNIERVKQILNIDQESR